MARYIDADEFEYTIMNEDVDVAEHRCKDYESYIDGANQFRFQMKNAIRNAPTADVAEVKRGEWIGDYDGRVSCSVCDPDREDDQPEYFKFMNYCPNCGAKMNHTFYTELSANDNTFYNE